MSRVLEQDPVDVGGIEFAAAELINRLGYVRDEFGELRLVIGRHHRASLLTIRLLGHELRLMRIAERENACTHRGIMPGSGMARS